MSGTASKRLSLKDDPVFIRNVAECVSLDLSIAEIADKLKTSYYMVYATIRNQKIRYEKHTHTEIPSTRKLTEDPATIRDLYENALTLKQIAERYSVTPVTVMHYMKKHGIPRRSKGEANTLRYVQNPKERERYRDMVFAGITGYPSSSRESWIEIECRLTLERLGIAYEQEFKIVGHGHSYDFRVGNLLIEMDGVYWHSNPKQAAKDAKHERIANEHGFRVVRITDAQVKDDPSVIERTIIDELRC